MSGRTSGQAGILPTGILPTGVLPAGIPASILPDISNLQQKSQDFINSLNFFNLPANEEAVPAVNATCGDETKTDTIWQNSLYPKIEGSLPGLCTLNITPPADTCALKVTFVDLAFNYESVFRLVPSFGCPQGSPSFKMSYNGGVTEGICTDLTNYEGILELDPANLVPSVLLLQLDPGKAFKFSINVTLIKCKNITLYKSPTICGIKNDANPATGRSDLPDYSVVREAPSEDAEVTSDSSQLDPTIRSDSNIILSDSTVRSDSTIRADMIRSVRNRRRSRQAIPVTTQSLVDNLQNKPDVFSLALAQGLVNGDIQASATSNRIIGVEPGIGEWPWMVVIERAASSFLGFPFPVNFIPCSGVLLDQYHVLTTASCALTVLPLSTVKVSSLRALVGEHDVTVLNETLTYNTSISKVTFPLTFNPLLLKDDVAVLKLTKPVDYQKTIRPVCLPVNYNVFKTDEVVVSGWGLGQTGPLTKLAVATANLTNETTCNQAIDSLLSIVSVATNIDIRKVDRKDYICVDKGTNISPVCTGDVAVPLVRRDQTGAYFLAGISTPLNVCGVQMPNLFTKINFNSTFLNLALVN